MPLGSITPGQRKVSGVAGRAVLVLGTWRRAGVPGGEELVAAVGCSELRWPALLIKGKALASTAPASPKCHPPPLFEMIKGAVSSVLLKYRTLFGLVHLVRNEWEIFYIRSVANIHFWCVRLLHITVAAWKGVKGRKCSQPVYTCLLVLHLRRWRSKGSELVTRWFIITEFLQGEALSLDSDLFPQSSLN